MTASQDNKAEAAQPRAVLRRGLTFALPVLVLIVSLIIAFVLYTSKPTAHRAKPVVQAARLVTVTPAEIAPPTLMLAANGTVEAADATALRARVSGQIVALTDKLAPGTRFAKGQVLARIDPADYRLALETAKVQLRGAQAALRVEQGQQAVAKGELALVDQTLSSDERDLVLRGPQLEQAKGEVASARTAVAQAQLDLQRATVRAPFAGIVTARSTSVGDVISSSETLANIAATDAYWVNVSLPVDQLRWLHATSASHSGSPAKIYYPDAWGDDKFMPASVLRIQAALESGGRLARVILRVPNPLGDGSAGSPRLLLGAYVQAKLQADIPDGSVAIDSAFLHENDQVWVFDHTHKLEVRSVKVVYRDDTQAVITSGLQAGEAVITSELTAPIPGMPLRVETQLPSVPSAAVTSDTPAPLLLRLSGLPPAGVLKQAANETGPDS